MSDINAAATPVDTTQVITESLQDAGLVDDAGNEVTADSTDDATTVDASTDDAAPVAPQNTDQTLSPEQDALLVEFGLKNENNRIPYKRAKKMLAKAREEAKAAALAEANQIREQYEAYHAQTQGILESLRVADSDPEKFLNALAQADPRYAQLLQARREAAQQQEQQQQAQFQPDVQFQDGSVGYSPEAFDRMLAARTKAVEEAIEQKFAQRFGPIEESFQAHQRQTAYISKANEAVARLIADAQTWPGFQENKEAITAAVQADKSLSLEAAYRKVVFGKLTQSRDEVRKQVLAEINAKSKASVSRPSSGAPAVTSNTPQSTEDIIRQSLRDKGLV